MENIENDTYSGFLWANRRPISEFPETVTTQSGKTYQIKEIFDNLYQNLQFISWAPQVAVLVHPSVSVFLTHGGAGSFYEGLYAGKRLIVFPFSFDQFANAHNARRSKFGEYSTANLDQTESNALLERVGLDINGTYQKNVNRFKALIQIHSRHGVLRGADLVEEVLFAADENGLLSYRFEASRQMSFIKSHNIDLFAAAALIVLLPLVLIGVAVKKLIPKKTVVPLMEKVDPKKTN